MANNKFPYTDKLPAFQAADDAWGNELVRVFGKNAGDARYTAQGKSTPDLLKLHDAREYARIAWLNSAYS